MQHRSVHESSLKRYLKTIMTTVKKGENIYIVFVWRLWMNGNDNIILKDSSKLLLLFVSFLQLCSRWVKSRALTGRIRCTPRRPSRVSKSLCIESMCFYRSKFQYNWKIYWIKVNQSNRAKYPNINFEPRISCIHIENVDLSIPSKR